MPNGTVTIPIDDYLKMLNAEKQLKKLLDVEAERLAKIDEKCNTCKWQGDTPEGVRAGSPEDPCTKCEEASNFAPIEKEKSK